MKALTLFACCLLLVGSPAVAKKQKEPPPPDIRQEVQVAVMSYADTWVSALAQNTASLAAGLESEEDELDLLRFTYFNQLSAYDIASGPYAGMALLDMMVLSTLTRKIWEGNWQEHYGGPNKNMLRVLVELEDGIWQTGSRYLTPQQQSSLRELVDEWWKNHPRAISASFVRLSDFGDLSRKPALYEATKKGGLLSPIRDAAQSAEDIKDLGERAIFLSIRMQELMMGRLDILTRQTLQDKDLKRLFNDISGFREIAEEYAEIVEGMPDELEGLVSYSVAEISREREEAITQMLVGITAERAAAVEQVMASVAMERQLMLEQVLEGLEEERRGVLKAVGHVFFWLELELRALVIRLFIMFSCLIVAWFGLRLIYRYWVERVANSFTKVLGVVILFLAMSIPLLTLGTYLVLEVTPDLSQKAEFEDEMVRLIDDIHK